jgi:hypothetical protein
MYMYTEIYKMKIHYTVHIVKWIVRSMYVRTVQMFTVYVQVVSA